MSETEKSTLVSTVSQLFLHRIVDSKSTFHDSVTLPIQYFPLYFPRPKRPLTGARDHHSITQSFSGSMFTERIPIVIMEPTIFKMSATYQ